MRREIAELRGELKAGFVTQDVYQIAHKELEGRVADNRAEIIALEEVVRGRPSWAVMSIITFLSAVVTGLLSAIIFIAL